MIGYLILAAACTAAYAMLMLRYSAVWRALPSSKLNPDFKPSTRISVLVAARNEAANIQKTIQNILAQNYPSSLFELIIIDDHSEDDTAALVEAEQAPNLRLLRLQEHLSTEEQIYSYKKKAIELGISKAKGELIVCTDADCEVPSHWLHLMAQTYEQEQAKFIAAPVEFVKAKSIFERFQALDFLGMMAITGAGIHARMMRMCNGANLAYPKAVFEELGGFQGIDQLASGDDMMLLQKVAAQYPQEIRFIKSPEALVATELKRNLSSFIRQRRRWASKSGSYQDWRTQLQLGIVWLFCCSLLLSLLLAPFWGWELMLCFGVQLGIKAFVDYQLLASATSFFHRKALLEVFIPALFLHSAYIIMVGTLSLFPQKYQWKGRTLR